MTQFDHAINIDTADSCQLCNHNPLQILIGPVDVDAHLTHSPVLICPKCGLIQKRLSVKNEELNTILEEYYYENYQWDDLLIRSKNRALVDTNRCVEYMRFIGSTIDWHSINKTLDIGGGEGLFSHVIKSIYPHIDVYCLEPDRKAVAVGKELYPEVEFLDISLEEINSIKEEQFDLITYWGGIYRTQKLFEAITALHQKISKNGFFVLSLPFTLEEPEQQACEPVESVDELLGCFRKGVCLLLNEFYMSEFLTRCFRVLQCEKRQNYPFLKKIPFLIAQRRESDELNENNSEYLGLYEKNIDFVLNYAMNETESRLRIFAKSHDIQTLIIIGTGPEAFIFARLAEKISLRVLFITDLLSKETNEKKISGFSVKSLSAVFEENPDCIMILDSENQEEIYDQMVNRLHLDTLFKIVKCFNKKNYPHKDVCFRFGDKTYLRKVCKFD